MVCGGVAYVSHEREVAFRSLRRRGDMVNCISFARLHCSDLKAQCGFSCGLDRASSGCLYRLGLRALLSGEKDMDLVVPLNGRRAANGRRRVLHGVLQVVTS